jgi:hypothetical protein
VTVAVTVTVSVTVDRVLGAFAASVGAHRESSDVDVDALTRHRRALR